MAFNSARTDLWRLIAFVAAYIGLSAIGANLSSPLDTEPALWPPAGLLIGCLLLAHIRHWPQYIAFALPLEMIARLWLQPSGTPVAVASALSLVLASIAGAASARASSGRFRMIGLQETLALFSLGAVIAPAFGAALFETLAALLGEPASSISFSARWASQATGILAFAPITIVILQPNPPWRSWDATDFAELVAMTLITVGIGMSVFRGAFPFTYVLLPLLLWASIRMEIMGAASFSVIVAVIAVMHTLNSRGIFADQRFDPAQRLWLAQLYILAMALSAYIVAGITRGRRRALEALQMTNAELERRVEERTFALQQSEERLRMALDAAKMEAFEFSPHTEKVHRIGEIAPMMNSKNETAEFFARVHPDDREALKSAIASATPDHPDYTVEYRFRAENGKWRWITDRAKMLFDEHGEALRAFGVLIDNTERRHAEDALRLSEARFSDFMQHLPGLAWIKSIDGRYIFANEAAEKAFRKPRAEFYGKTDAEIFPPHTAAQFRQHDLDALASHSGVITVETLQQEDGVLHHSLVSKFPMWDGVGVLSGVGGVAIDITERVIAEQKLLAATEQLREADRRKDEFLAMLAHELRNPLAPIRNGLHILRLSEGRSERATRVQHIMERQVDHLVRLVDDLMEVSRISRGKITLKKRPVDLVQVIEEAIDMSRQMIESEGLELVFSAPLEEIMLDADPVRLTQIFANILNNAAKYTSRGGRVEIAVRRLDGEACVTIADTGVGIAADMLPRVFDLFGQVDRTLSRAKGGLGIGLALVKSLVELHGGAVSAESDGEGRGSRFIVRLPLAPGDMQQQPLRDIAPAAG